MKLNYLMTCDVEEHSIEKNTLDDNVIYQVHKQGLPRLLNLFDKHDIKCTFFFTGYYASKCPKSLEMVKRRGHEVGCHSFSHHPDLALDRLSFRQQVREVSKAKYIIEKIVGPIVSFRAPALRINKFTFEALIKSGFEYDSSVSPGRFDGPLSSGFTEKLKWLSATSGVHEIPSKLNTNKKIIEVPMSAYLFPYIGTLSRISPNLMDILRPLIFKNSLNYGYPAVFDTHPNECVELVGKPVTNRRSKNLIKYIFGDLLRHKLKLKNLGSPAIDLLEKEIILAKKHNFSFKRVKDMRV